MPTEEKDSSKLLPWQDSVAVLPLTPPYVPKLLAVVFFAVVALLAFLLARRRRQVLLKDVPIVGLEEGSGADIKDLRARFRYGSKNMLLEGYRKYKGGLFYVPTPRGERLMVPPKYVEELKTATNETADFPATFIEMFEGQITTIGTEQTLHPRIIKNDLNLHMASILPQLDDEIKASFADLIPSCEDWTELNVAETLTRTVARASSRMFGGTHLSRYEPWTNTMIDFTGDSFLAAQRLKDFPAWTRQLVRFFIPEVKKIFQHFALADSLISPVLAARSEESRPKEDKSGGGTGKKNTDLIQWLLDNREHRTNRTLSHINLHVAFAAIHTSAVAVTHIVYDLCAMPEYVEPLREEIMKALEEEGFLTKKALLKMSKLDSFMRESQRFNPLLLITYERVLPKDLRLKDGQLLPANTQIGVPAHAIGFDPESYPDPEKFDGFRFHNLRHQQPGPAEANDSSNSSSSGQTMYVASNLSNMSWGYGRHACPGRWFADAEIKMILVYLLLEYDFKFPPGKSRPESMEFETQNLPDKTATVMLMKRAL